MPESPLPVWKDAEGGENTLVNAATFTADLLEMSRKSVCQFNWDGMTESAVVGGWVSTFVLLPDEMKVCFRAILNQ